MKKSKVAYMSREELIVFLVKKLPELVKQLPTGKERDHFESRPTADLREWSLGLCDD